VTAYTTTDGVTVEVVDLATTTKITAALKKLLAAVGIPEKNRTESYHVVKFPDGTIKATHERVFASEFKKVT
jgi:hypothetical protein